MRIAIIARRAQGINGTGGMERAATELALGLSHLGHEVELVTSPPLSDVAIALPFRVSLLPPRQRTGVLGWWDYRRWVKVVARHVETSPPDFIVSFYGDIAALPAGGPPALLFTYGLEWFVTPGIHGLGLRRLYGPLGLAAIRRADYLGTCGPVHLAALDRLCHPAGEAVRIHNWMRQNAGPSPARDEAKAALGLPTGAVVLGVVSRLARDKGLEIAVRSVRALREEFPGLHLVIAGDGPERATLESAAQGDPGIHLLGRVDDATAHRVLRAADATVSVARTQYQMFAVIEALSVGTPVLCAHAERQEGLIKEGVTGFALPRPDEASMQHALRRLLTMPADARAAMEAACLREVAHGYTLDDAIAAVDATGRRALTCADD